jgi:hypothetical protein
VSTVKTIGIVLVILGLLFIVLALIAAARKVLLKSHEPAPAGLGAFDPKAWAKLLEAATAFVKAAPEWLLLAVVGAALVAWGGSML